MKCTAEHTQPMISSGTNSNNYLQIELLYLTSISPPPWKILEKCTTEGLSTFKCTVPSVWFLDQVFHRGSKYFIQKYPMSLSIWNSHSPCARCFLNLPQGVYGIQMEFPNPEENSFERCFNSYVLHTGCNVSIHESKFYTNCLTILGLLVLIWMHFSWWIQIW